MKNQYEKLDVNVVHFEQDDVIRTSNPAGGGDPNELLVKPFPTFKGLDFGT